VSHTCCRASPSKTYLLSNNFAWDQIRNNGNRTESSSIWLNFSSLCWIGNCILKCILHFLNKRLTSQVYTHWHLCVCLSFSPLFGLSETYSSPHSSFVFLSLHFAGWRWGIDQKQNGWAVLQDPPVLTDFKAGWDCVWFAWLGVWVCVRVCVICMYMQMYVSVREGLCACVRLWICLCVCLFLSVYTVHPWNPTKTLVMV